jgi:hypothetical protein
MFVKPTLTNAPPIRVRTQQFVLMLLMDSLAPVLLVFLALCVKPTSTNVLPVLAGMGLVVPTQLTNSHALAPPVSQERFVRQISMNAAQILVKTAAVVLMA